MFAKGSLFSSTQASAGHARSARVVCAAFTVLLLAFASGCSSVPIAGQASNGTGGGTAAAASGATLPPAPSAFPAGFMPSVKSYGAVGDGVTDDTAAIQAALADGRSDTSLDYYGRPKALYFPAGTYLVHDTLRWTGCCVTLQGAGSGSSVIRLAPHSPGFDDPSAPKPLVMTPAGNQSFHENVWDLALSVGPGNPGATGLDYISNNSGSVHNVLVKSEDGTGVDGIAMTRKYAGPLLIRNTEVVGFDRGMDLSNAEYGATLEAITLQGQNVAGIHNINQPLSIRGLVSSNTVPALTNQGGQVVLLDGSLQGGGPSVAALQTNAVLYLRNVSATGYASTLANTSANGPGTMGGSIAELLTGAPQTLTGDPDAGSLKLQVAETPSYADADLSQWVAFTPQSYGDTSSLQSTFNAGKSTVYFPFGSYFAYNEAAVTVPDSVHRIVGFSSIVNGSTGGNNGGGIRLVITSDSTEPLIIEQFGYGLKIDHRGSRPVVIKDAKVSYTSSPGAGDLYLEDVEATALTVQPGQHLWARQLNDEVAGTKIANNGGTAWILGLKTERGGTVIDTEAGGQTELLGGFIYPAMAVPSTDVAFRSVDSQVSYIYTESVYCASCGYATQVEEIREGVDRRITSPANSNFRMPLFAGYR